MKKKIAVLLAGCGSFDGSEIHETVLTLLSIEQAGATYQCFSINENQHHVTNHSSISIEAGQNRNMLEESGRIARGNIKNITDLLVDDYDALIIPGGFGVAHNLCDFAFKGKDFAVRPDVKEKCLAFSYVNKPVGFICISPVMISKIYNYKVRMTLGRSENLETMMAELGMDCVPTNVDEICIDTEHRIVTTAAYMLAENISQVYQGILKLVVAVVNLSSVG